MRYDIPIKLRESILQASNIQTEKTQETEETTQDFRDDSPFSTEKTNNEDLTVEDSINWLHECGYTYQELYSLLMSEIETLRKGYERQKEREKSQTNEGKSKTKRSHGNRGDRARELGWR